ncbi:alpha/beta fold hydrolase [Arsukibacterium sp.]|uniref:alpha/beta fold hydrolase n=1 Tax=Arsukibacterium sp. TaxID=1977258 RepID=UPI002FD8DC29
MKVIIPLLMLLLLSAIASPLQAAPLPGDKVFAPPFMSGPQFSPNGQFILTQIIHQKTLYLSLIDTQSMNFTHVVKIAPEQSLRSYQWLDNDNFFVEYRETGDLIQGIATLVKDQSGITAQLRRLWLGGDLVASMPQRQFNLLYATEQRSNKQFKQLHQISVDRFKNSDLPRSTMIATELQRVLSYFYDEQSDSLFAMQLASDNLTLRFSFKKMQDTNWTLLFTTQDEELAFIPVGFLSATELAVLSNQGTNTLALQAFDITSGQLGNILYQHPRYDLVSATITMDGQVESVEYYEDGQHRTHYLQEDANNLAIRLGEAFAGKQIYQVADNKTLQSSILFVYAADDPGTYYLYNHRQRQAIKLTEAYPDLQAFQFATNRSFNLESEPGVTIEAYLTLPQSELDHKVLLVMPHGGPVGVRDYDYFNSQLQYLVSRGFSVLRVNFRGSAGFGKQFLESGTGQFGKAIEQDITAAVERVKQQFQFQKMCAVGSSYGGYSALMLAIKHPEDYQCVVAAYGIYDLPLLFNASNIKTTDEYQRRTSRVVGANTPQLKQYSPFYLADHIKVPLLLIAGEEDNIADFEHSQRLHYLLNRLKRPVETLFYKRTGHGHSNPYWQWHENAYLTDFIYRSLEIDMENHAVVPQHTAYLAEDYLLLAKSFYGNARLTEDMARSMRFHQQASQLGNAEAAYHMGLIYADENGIFYDVNQARLSLQLAAERDQAEAYVALGRLYSTEQPLDFALAINAYQQAIEKGASLAARAGLAQLHCLGQGVTRDVANCASQLSLSTQAKSRTLTQAERGALRLTLANVFMQGQYDALELNLLQQVLSSEYGIGTATSSIKVQQVGLMDDNNKVLQSTNRVQAQPKQRLGMRFDNNFRRQGQQHVAVFARWLLIDSNGQQRNVQNNLLWGSDSKDWNVSYKLTPQDLSAKQLRLELADIDGKLLLSQDFTLLQPSI